MNCVEFSAFIRVFPVRCLVSVNTFWVTDALNDGGYDGIGLLDDKKGGSRQCHGVNGSEFTHSGVKGQERHICKSLKKAQELEAANMKKSLRTLDSFVIPERAGHPVYCERFFMPARGQDRNRAAIRFRDRF